MSVETDLARLQERLTLAERELHNARMLQNAWTAQGLDELLSIQNDQPRPFQFFGATAVNNTTTVTTLAEVSIPPRRLNVNRGLRLTVAGTYRNNSGSGRVANWRCTLAGTDIWHSAPTMGTGAATRTWRMMVELYANASFDAQILTGDFAISSAGAPTVGLGNINQGGAYAPIQGSDTEDLTQRATFAIRFSHDDALSSIQLSATRGVAEWL